MLHKYINEHQIQCFSGWWRVGDTIVTNSDAEALALASGEWFPLVEDEQPEYDPEKQYLAYHYEQEAEAIRKVYTVVDIPIEPTEEATEADYIEALERLGVTDE